MDYMKLAHVHVIMCASLYWSEISDVQSNTHCLFLCPDQVCFSLRCCEVRPGAHISAFSLSTQHGTVPVKGQRVQRRKGEGMDR